MIRSMNARVFPQVLALPAGLALACVLIQPMVAHGSARAVESTLPDEASLPLWYLRQPGAISATFDLGTELDGDRELRSRKVVFSPGDAIVASVVTEVSGDGKALGLLEAIFTYDFDGEEMIVAEESRDIEFSSRGVTNFEISKPDGFPEGRYHVEIRLNNVVIGKKGFEVLR